MPGQPQIQLGWDNAALQAGANQAARTVDTLEKKANKSLSSIGPKKFTFGGVTGQALAVTAAFAGVKHAIDGLDSLNDLGIRLGVDAEEMQRLALMAKLGGTDVETMVKALFKFNLALRDTDNKGAVEALRQLGINASEFIKLDPVKQLAALGPAFQRAEAQGKGFNAAFDLLGKTASELLPILRQDAAAMQEIADTDVISNEDVQAMANFNDELDKAAQRALYLGQQALKSVSDGLTIFLNTIKEAVTNGISLTAAFNRTIEEMAQLKLEAEEAAEAQRKQAQATLDAAAAARQHEAELKAEAEAAKLAKEEAEKLKREQEKAQQQSNNLATYQAEVAIIEEQARGHNKKAEAMQRNLKIAQDTARLMEQMGLSEEEALKLATRRADAEDKLNNKQSGKRGTKGYSQSQQSFKDAQNPFRNLDKMHNDQYGDFWARNQKTPGLDAFDAMQERAPGGGRANPAFPGTTSRNFGITRRAAASERAAAAAQADRNLEPDILRVLQSLDAAFAKALN